MTNTKIEIKFPRGNLREVVKEPTAAQVAEALRVLRDYQLRSAIDTVIEEQADEHEDISPQAIIDGVAELFEDCSSRDLWVIETLTELMYRTADAEDFSITL